MNCKMLRDKIADSGMSIVSIANKIDISRESLYNKMNGKTDFTAREITGLTTVLMLTRKERDEIFFDN